MSKKSAKTKTAPYVAPTLTWEEHRAYTIRSWESQRDYALAELKKFAEKVTGENPQYAMEWGQTAFTYAAKHTVYTVLLSILKQDTVTNADQFIACARSYADSAIRDGPQQSSTSAASNEAKKRLGEEWLREVYGTWPKQGFEKTISQIYPETNPVMAGL